MREIGFLAFLPVGLALPLSRVGEAIGAGLDDFRYPFTEPVTDILKPCLAALIFDAVVEQCCNSEIFVPAVFQNRRCTASKWATYGVEVPLRLCPP